MPSFTFLPVADFRNEGWSLVGTAVSKIFEAINNDDDNKYIVAPASKAAAAVTFPVDTTSVPDGAVIVSVTVKARIALGNGSAPAGSAPSVTFSVGAQDDTSRYTTRTVYPTSQSPSTYEIATYSRDALGEAWDVFRLNYLFAKIFSFVGISDLIRIYKLFLEIKYRTRPTVTVTAPTGVVSTSSPVVSWTYSQTDGDPQHHADIRIFTADQVTQIGFYAGLASPVWEGRVDGDIQSLTLPTSLNSNSYWVYVRAASSFFAHSTWVGRQFTVQSPSPGIPGVEDPSGGDPFIDVVHDSETGSASLTMRDTSNMLSAQEADAESLVDISQITATNGTVTRDATTAFPGGSASWKVVATAGGDVNVYTDWQEVMAGQPMTATAQLLAATTGRNYRIRVLFYDNNFNAVAGTLTGANVMGSTGTWVNPEVTGTVAAGATYARMSVDILSALAAEVHNVDRLGIMYGTNAPWSDGGQMSRNLLSSWYSSPGSSAQAGESWTAGPATSVTTDTATGTGASGSVVNKMTYVGATPTIAFRAAGTVFTSATSGTDFTLNKPAGTTTGDLLLAFITSSEDSTVNVPSGWTLVNSSTVNDGARDTALFVLKRKADGTEPASWNGSVSITSGRRTAAVVAYSGAGDILTETKASTGNDTPAFVTTPALNNTDPAAWRVSAFAVSDNASGGTLTANRNAPTATAQIQYVGKATGWGANTQISSFRINKPANLQTGDVMVASVYLAVHDITSITHPSGWTLQYFDDVGGAGENDGAMMVYTRVATASEPSSWTGTFSAQEVFLSHISECLAYRNVNTTTPFITSGGEYYNNAKYLTTPTLNNTNSYAWRLSIFGAGSNHGNASWSGADTVERVDEYAAYTSLFGNNTSAMAFYDSNGPVSTGSTSRTGTYSQNAVVSGVAFLAFLNPATSVPTVGDETVRATAQSGAADPWMTTRVFDSGGVIPTGPQSITGIWSASDMNSMSGWHGIIQPSAAVTSGFASATMASAVDISAVDKDRVTDSDCVTVTAAFLGSTSGTAYLQCNFYRANVLLEQKIEVAGSFNSTYWQKTVVQFEVPEGTTRMTLTVSAADRAVSDIVYWDRTSLSFGTDPTYRSGTSRSTHPVWSRPQIQYADDTGSGYGEFADLPGSKLNPPAYEQLSGDAYYTDHTPIPLTNRIYRARTETLGLQGDVFVSAWGPTSSEYNFVARNWWLKDLRNPENNIQLKVAWESFTVTKSNTAAVFQPIGEDLPVVLTEGYKGDSFAVNLIPVNHDDWFALTAMLESGRTLFLQTDIDHAWWVRPVGDLSQTVLATGNRRANPQRAINISFIEVASEE